MILGSSMDPRDTDIDLDRLVEHLDQTDFDNLTDEDVANLEREFHDMGLFDSYETEDEDY